jgi:hypothetical protein
MHDHARALLLGVDHSKLRTSRFQPAAVTDLAAGLGVKRRVLQHDDAGLTSHQFLDAGAISEQRGDARGVIKQLIAGELATALHLQLAGVVRGELAGRTRAAALDFHRLFKPLDIKRETTFPRDIRGQVDRKTIRIIEPEHGLTRYYGTLHGSQALVQDAHALLQGFGETFFLEFEDTLDMRLTSL